MYSICLLLFLQVYITTSAPTGPGSLIDQLAKECPNRKFDFPELKDCPSWAVIQNVTVLTDTTNTEIKCLLLYTNIVNFCTHSKSNDVPTSINPPPPPQVCQTLTKSLTKKIQYFDSGCSRLCWDYAGNADKKCSLAYDLAIAVEQSAISAPAIVAANVKPQETIEPKDSKVETVQKPAEKLPAPPAAVDEPIREPTPVKKPIVLVAAPPPANQPEPAVQTVKNDEESKPDVKIPLKPETESQSRLNSPVNTKIEEKPKKVLSTSVELVKTTAKAKEEQPAEVQSQEHDLPIEPEQTVKEAKKDPIEEEEPEPPQAKEPLMAEDDEDQEDEVQQEEDKFRGPAIVPEEDDKPPPKHGHHQQMLDDSISVRDDELNNGDSSFFSYFMIVSVLCVMFYVGYHNRQKIMALLLEGKRTRRPYRGRRPNSANYHKLDSNLEEAISSSCSKTTSNVIY